jgi:hypothetical protein
VGVGKLGGRELTTGSDLDLFVVFAEDGQTDGEAPVDAHTFWSGAVERLTDAGRAGHLGLPRVAAELYRSARRFRAFVASPPKRPLDPVLDLLTLPAAEVTRKLAHHESLLEE